MGLIDRFRQNAPAPSVDEVFSEADRLWLAESSNEILAERIASLELALEDEGWRRFGLQGEEEFSRGGIDQIIDLSRLMFLKSPLIRRAVRIHQFYVFGQGVEFRGRDDSVQEVIRRFTKDAGNRKELFGHQGQHRKEQTVRTDGNVFLVLFTNPVTGHVRVRSVSAKEVREIVCDPNDRQTPWFYQRTHTVRTLNMDTGVTEETSKTAWHPDWRHRPLPGRRPSRIGQVPVRWDSPIYHIRVGGLEHMQFGVPEVYAALDWARAHKEYLENWSSIEQALARFAWKFTGTKAARDSAKTKMETGVAGGGSQGESNPPPVTGAVAFTPDRDAGDLTPISKSGAHVSAEDSRQLRLQVAAAVDVPDTMLSGDADMGSLATATTLDRPTELAMRDRQVMWTQVYRDLFDYAVRAAVRAPAGKLRGRAQLVHDADLGEMVDGGLDTTVDITWPPVLEKDIKAFAEAWTKITTLDGRPAAGTVPPKVFTRETLTAMQVHDVDEIVDQIPDDLWKQTADVEQPPAERDAGDTDDTA